MNGSGDSRARREDRGDERIGRRRERVVALRVEFSKVAFDWWKTKNKAADQSTTQALRVTDAGQRPTVGHSLDARDVASVISGQSVQAGQFFFEPRLNRERVARSRDVPEQEASKGSEPE